MPNWVNLAIVCLLAAIVYLQVNPFHRPTQVFDLTKQEITLTYFDLRGRAEAVRLLLEELGLKYTDVRVQRDEWNDLKQHKKFTFGQLPHLQVGNISIAQSYAQASFLAKAAGLHGNDIFEETQMEIIAMGIEDLRKRYSALVYGGDFESSRLDYINNVIPQWLGYFELILLENGGFYGGGQYFVGENFTFIDILVFELLDLHVHLTSDALNSFPALKGFYKRIKERPRIAAYLNSSRRPKQQNGGSAKWGNTPDK